MIEKIQKQHLERKAVLYVRQSSPYRVAHNEESRRLQYAMRERLKDFGWQEIEVIDEDTGTTATGVVTRDGFDRMVADVCLGKVGAVAAWELSRFARNSREWQQLIEVCRLNELLRRCCVSCSRRLSKPRFGPAVRPAVSRMRCLTPYAPTSKQHCTQPHVLRNSTTQPIRRTAWSLMNSNAGGIRPWDVCGNWNTVSKNIVPGRRSLRLPALMNSQNWPMTWKRYGMIPIQTPR